MSVLDTILGMKIGEGLMKQPSRGLRVRPQAYASSLPPTLTMKAGDILGDYLGSIREIFPAENPYGTAVENFLLGDSERLASDMASGDPYALIDTRAGRQLVDPAALDATGALPLGLLSKSVAAAPKGSAAFVGAVSPMLEGDMARYVDDVIEWAEPRRTTKPLPRGAGKRLQEEKKKLRDAIKTHASLKAERLAKGGGKKRAEMAAEEKVKAATKEIRGLENLRTNKSTIEDPLRISYPGIYKPASLLASEAERKVAAENPALKELFGVTRDDLFGILQDRGEGPRSSLIERPSRQRPNPAAEKVMGSRNTERLLENLDVATREAPGLVRGMAPWYVMDPAYTRLVELVGPEEAAARYNQFNTLTGMASPGSDVITELRRGSAANMLATQGRFDDFENYVGLSEGKRAKLKDFPPDLVDAPGHAYHSTAHGKPMRNYLDSGEVNLSSVKVPTYIEASGIPGVPGIPFQSGTPIGDAHYVRGIGLSDAREPRVDPGKSISPAELRTLEDWWQNQVARPSGLESVPTQAINWGLYGPQTGVETELGVPKLELLAGRIKQRAAQLGMDPRQLRDEILLGKNYAEIAATAGLGGLLGSSLYEPETQL